MVLISLKSTGGGANDGFLYETTTSTPVENLIQSLVDIHNARLRGCLIADSVKGLAEYGVMKQPEDTGTDEVSAVICIGRWRMIVYQFRAIQTIQSVSIIYHHSFFIF